MTGLRFVGRSDAEVQRLAQRADLRRLLRERRRRPRTRSSVTDAERVRRRHRARELRLERRLGRRIGGAGRTTRSRTCTTRPTRRTRRCVRKVCANGGAGDAVGRGGLARAAPVVTCYDAGGRRRTRRASAPTWVKMVVTQKANDQPTPRQPAPVAVHRSRSKARGGRRDTRRPSRRARVHPVGVGREPDDRADDGDADRRRARRPRSGSAREPATVSAIDDQRSRSVRGRRRGADRDPGAAHRRDRGHERGRHARARRSTTPPPATSPPSRSRARSSRRARPSAPGDTMPQYAILALGSSASETGIKLTRDGHREVAGPIASNSPATGAGGINSVSGRHARPQGLHDRRRRGAARAPSRSSSAPTSGATPVRHATPIPAIRRSRSPTLAPDAEPRADLHGRRRRAPVLARLLHQPLGPRSPASYTANGNAVPDGLPLLPARRLLLRLRVRPCVHEHDLDRAREPDDRRRRGERLGSRRRRLAAAGTGRRYRGRVQDRRRRRHRRGAVRVRRRVADERHGQRARPSSCAPTPHRRAPTSRSRSTGSRSAPTRRRRPTTACPSRPTPTPASGWTGLTPVEQPAPDQPEHRDDRRQCRVVPMVPAVAGGASGSIAFSGYARDPGRLDQRRRTRSRSRTRRSVRGTPTSRASRRRSLRRPAAPCTYNADARTSPARSSPTPSCSVPRAGTRSRAAGTPSATWPSRRPTRRSPRTSTASISSSTYTPPAVRAESGCVLTNVANCSVIKVGTGQREARTSGAPSTPRSRPSRPRTPARVRSSSGRGVIARTVVNSGTPPADSTGGFCLGARLAVCRTRRAFCSSPPLWAATERLRALVSTSTRRRSARRSRSSRGTSSARMSAGLRPGTALKLRPALADRIGEEGTAVDQRKVRA